MTGIKDMGYVGMVNDYIGNDVYTAQKIMASYESVVVVSDTADGKSVASNDTACKRCIRLY